MDGDEEEVVFVEDVPEDTDVNGDELLHLVCI